MSESLLNLLNESSEWTYFWITWIGLESQFKESMFDYCLCSTKDYTSKWNHSQTCFTVTVIFSSCVCLTCLRASISSPATLLSLDVFLSLASAASSPVWSLSTSLMTWSLSLMISLYSFKHRVSLLLQLLGVFHHLQLQHLIACVLHLQPIGFSLQLLVVRGQLIQLLLETIGPERDQDFILKAFSHWTPKLGAMTLLNRNNRSLWGYLHQSRSFTARKCEDFFFPSCVSIFPPMLRSETALVDQKRHGRPKF